jgi:signal transduction histidine kinase
VPDARRAEAASRTPGAFSIRLGLWYALVFLAGGALLLVLTYALLANALRERDHELVAASLDQYVGQYKRGGLAALSEAVATDRLAGRTEGLVVRITGATGQAVFASIPGSWEALGFEVASARLPDGTVFEVGKSSEARADILARFRAGAALAFAAVVLFALAGAALATRTALRPLRRLTSVLHGIVRTGQVSSRVEVRGDGDALDDLGRLANEMLDRIEALLSGMRGSLDNVAHDLRTPLQRLRARAENALREGESPEVLRAALTECIEECDRVAAMLTALMDISEAETGAMALHREALDVRGLLHETAGLYEDAAEEKGISIAVDAPADLTLTGDRTRLRQALANLVDNAVKYTPRGGHIWLRGRPEGDRVVLECADDGGGVAPDDLPRIWDRLYRGDRSRSERGLGLGLSLVRAIAHAHGGDARALSAPGQGATFRLELPAS